MALGLSIADVVTGISSMATRHVLTELADVYEQRSRQRVAIVSAGGVEAARRINDGESFDFVVLAAEAIERLAANGRVEPGSRTDLARSGVAIAVAAGATRPDASTESAIRDGVLRARSIGYSSGPSGAHLVRLFERWGIADAIAPRIVQAQPGIPVASPHRPRRCRAGVPAAERVDASAGHRRHRPAPTGDPGDNRVLGGGMHRIERSRGRQGAARLSHFIGSRCGEAPPWHGAGMSRRASRTARSPSLRIGSQCFGQCAMKYATAIVNVGLIASENLIRRVRT